MHVPDEFAGSLGGGRRGLAELVGEVAAGTGRRLTPGLSRNSDTVLPPPFWVWGLVVDTAKRMEPDWMWVWSIHTELPLPTTRTVCWISPLGAVGQSRRHPEGQQTADGEQRQR